MNSFQQVGGTVKSASRGCSSRMGGTDLKSQGYQSRSDCNTAAGMGWPDLRVEGRSTGNRRRTNLLGDNSPQVS